MDGIISIVIFHLLITVMGYPYQHSSSAQIMELAENSSACVTGDTCKSKNGDQLNFFLIGDSGGQPIYPYVTYGQMKVARHMSNLARKLKPEFMLTLGDNIYYTGVENVDDNRFMSSFENAYSRSEFNVPWYMIAGNHDHFGNISAQILYTKYSEKWTFPSEYYKVSYKLANHKTLIEFIMIDTIILCGNTRNVTNGGFFDMLRAEKVENPNQPNEAKASQAQMEWIEQQLKNSKAHYLFVAGHYPIYSVASHGPSQCLLDKLDPLLKKYSASAYFSGHDHNLQHLIVPHKPNQSTDQKAMNYIVSGASSRSDRSTKHLNDVPTGSLKFRFPKSFNPLSQLGFTNGAFIAASIGKDSAVLRFYDGAADDVYQCHIKPRHRFR